MLLTPKYNHYYYWITIDRVHFHRSCIWREEKLTTFFWNNCINNFIWIPLFNGPHHFVLLLLIRSSVDWVTFPSRIEWKKSRKNKKEKQCSPIEWNTNALNGICAASSFNSNYCCFNQMHTKDSQWKENESARNDIRCTITSLHFHL